MIVQSENFLTTFSQDILRNLLTSARTLVANDIMPREIGRAIVDFTAQLLYEPPRGLKIEKEDIDGMSALWISDKRFSTTNNVLLYFHGGGYHMCSPYTHKRLVYKVCRTARLKSLVIDYRKSPEHRFPAPIEDGEKAYNWLLERGYKSENIVFGGDSAGGGLTMAVLLQIKERGYPLPKAAFCISPWVDLECIGDTTITKKDRDPWLGLMPIKSYARTYLNGNHPRHYLASPIYGDLKGLPPILIHVGSDEILLDDARRLYEKALESGTYAKLKVWENMIHVFQSFDAFFKDAHKSIYEIGKFLRTNLAVSM
ncbi:MAG: alpha/beta hydrolase [Leptospiraceae bacterium]|nr:alpha/beta hydrolase [Leptospiraceae bacterium]